MPVRHTFKDYGAAPVKIWTDQIEDSALQQLRNLSTLPFVHKHIAVMPDVHAGIGSTVGTVIATRKAIIPAAVGVDIGCGMIAHKLSIRADQLPDNLGPLRSAIEAAVPHGRTDNGGTEDKGAWHYPPDKVKHSFTALFERLLPIANKEPRVFGRATDRAIFQLGTLGTGNHFIELCVDKENGVWIMLHSGSRGIGNKIGQYYIEQAKREMERYFIRPAHPDLSYLPANTALFDDYWNAVQWAQDYAKQNRACMMNAVLDAVKDTLGINVLAANDLTAVECHHNYVAIENHFGENVYVTRKGAVRARKGDLGIIPGSMGARSFIVRGKGNPESFNSCSHGAGRTMSRTEAKRRFTIEDLAAQTKGVECRKDADVIDEIPGAYKNIDAVMANQSDLVDIVAELRQVLCVKG